MEGKQWQDMGGGKFSREIERVVNGKSTKTHYKMLIVVSEEQKEKIEKKMSEG
jgi:hypothetical protein